MRAKTYGVLLLSFLAFGTSAFAGCEYRLDKDSSQVNWIAYKFTERAAVKGSFRDVQIESRDAKNMNELLKSVTFTIDGKSIESGDPSRNANIASQFFGKMEKEGKITGSFAEIEKGKKPVIHIHLNLNGTQKKIALPYAIKGDVITLSGTVDLLDIGLKGPFDSIHAACKELHRGKDGVAKTWSTVDLEIQSKFKKTCK